MMIVQMFVSLIFITYSMGIDNLEWKQIVETLSMRVSAIEMENSLLTSSNQHLKERVDELSAEIRVLKNTKDKFSINETVTVKPKRLLLPGITDKNSSTTPVAFSAVLNHHVTLGTHQTIEYENVLTNIGQAYDPKHGHFIAPNRGIYMISVTGYCFNQISTYLEVVHNGRILINLFMDGRDGQNSGITETLFIEMNAGDMVWIRGRAGGKLYGDTVENCNSFSGFRLIEL